MESARGQVFDTRAGGVVGLFYLSVSVSGVNKMKKFKYETTESLVEGENEKRERKRWEVHGK